MSGKLYIVGTPIGNLEDITLRALRILKEVDYIACEDTRVTRVLLNHYDIKEKKIFSYHDKNERESSLGVMKLLDQGYQVALVSDAGMPVINDPGYILIREAIKAKREFEVIPGVSATLMTAVLCNFDTYFSFIGFLKPKSGQRQNQLSSLHPGTHIVFASPHRISDELKDIQEVFGSDFQIFVGRELTKKFETHYRGPISEVITQLGEETRGEFTLAFEVPKPAKKSKYDSK